MADRNGDVCARGACGSVRKGDGERDGRERGKRLETSFGVADHQTFPFFLLGSCLILSRWRGVALFWIIFYLRVSSQKLLL